MMLVKVEELTEGCIVDKDVYSLTNRPIVPENTVLTDKLISFLKAFLIKEVHIKKYLVDGKPFNPDILIQEESKVADKTKMSLIETFLTSVNEFKKEFNSWRAGAQVNVARIREIILPLLENLKREDLFKLHHFSTEKEYLYQHSIAVGLLSAFIGEKIGYGKGDIVQLAVAGCLCDCGMAKIEESIINKSTALTERDFEEIKKHPGYSYRMIQNSPLIKEGAKIAIFQHHERLDGSGYPLGEKDAKIHPFAKIFAVSDTFHAMTSERVYRKKQSPFKVLEMMLQDNFGKFDIVSLNALQSLLINFSIGSTVKLTNGQFAEILFIHEKSPTRPLVKILDTEEIINLERNREIFIEEVL